jgi:UDP-N-acetylmuramate dehydrogenase
VDWIEAYDGKKVLRLGGEECRFGYRDSIFKGKKKFVVLRICLRLNKGERGALKYRAYSILKERRKKYSSQPKCAGSFFKNIKAEDVGEGVLGKIDKEKIVGGKIPAGYLLEASGAKGMKVGHARVADFNANFIISDGKAKFRDVKKLAALMKEKVYNKFGILLEEEVRYIE